MFSVIRFFQLKIVLLVMVVGMASAYGAPSGKPQPITSVTATLLIKVSEKAVKTDLCYTYVAFENNQSEIRFFLNADMKIGVLKGEDIKGFHFDIQASPLPTVTIFLKKPVAKGKVIPFTLSYTGQPKNGFETETYEWIDFDSDYILFPLFTNFQYFTYMLQASLDDPGYKFIEAERLQLNNKMTLTSKTADYAIASLFACKDLQFKTFKEEGNQVTIISNQPDSTKLKTANVTLRLFRYYNSTFGKETPQHQVVIISKPLPLSVNPVQKTSGNLIVLASDSNEETLTHEVAHLWWNRGNHSTMEKWLTESFAVYSQLMYLRSTGHQREFDEEIARLKVKAEKLPPLLKADRFSYEGNGLIYAKGPYLLCVLETQLGKEKFIQFLSSLNRNKVSTTQAFLSELEKTGSKEIRIRFEELLN